MILQKYPKITFLMKNLLDSIDSIPGTSRLRMKFINNDKWSPHKYWFQKNNKIVVYSSTLTTKSTLKTM